MEEALVVARAPDAAVTAQVHRLVVTIILHHMHVTETVLRYVARVVRDVWDVQAVVIMHVPVDVHRAPDVLIAALVHVERRAIRHVVHIPHVHVALVVQVDVEEDVIPVAVVQIRVVVNAIKHAQHIAQIRVKMHVLQAVLHIHHVVVEPTVALRAQEHVPLHVVEHVKMGVLLPVQEDVLVDVRDKVYTRDIFSRD